ncbi:MAG: hypothetical protein CMJ25_16165 [Phycisphaerae bacterium]|nr:hypothetical protein [Phycisphaerae bacterium]
MQKCGELEGRLQVIMLEVQEATQAVQLLSLEAQAIKLGSDPKLEEELEVPVVEGATLVFL